MIRAAKAWAKRRWPRLRLRTILFATLFAVAAMPGIGAVFLRVYENTLVRQTESELVAQGAALAATAQMLWPGAAPIPLPPFRAEAPTIDLSSSPILPERPAAMPAGPADPQAVAAARRLLPILARTQRTTLAGMILLDRTGIVVEGPEAGRSLAMLPEVRAALGGHPDTVLRMQGGYRAVYYFEWLSRAAAIRVHHARPIVVNGKVVGVLLLSRSARALFKGLYQDRGKIALGVLVIFGLLVVLSGVISRGITRPIEQLGAATRAVASGRGTVPEVPPTAAIEIQGLYADFAVMAAEIERRSRYLRDVAYAVSHEFKTPLAGIRGAIELLQDHDASMSAEERHRFLANADADAGRLAQLVTRLLDLARADMTQAAPDAATLLAPVIARVADAHRRPGFAVEVAALPPVPVAVPGATVEAVLATLLENAAQAGAQRLSIAVEHDEAALSLIVADDGPGMAAADRARLFEPFFTTRRSEGGTGLGLAIARSLLDAARATIEPLETEIGLAFAIRMPLASHAFSG